MNGDVSASMRAIGMPYKLNFGLDAASLREIGGSITPDAELAETLWMESSRECKILATMVYPKATFSREQAESWLSACFTTELLEQFVFNLLQHLPFASELATTWSNHQDTSFRSAGYMLTLRLLISKKIPAVDATSLNRARTDTLDPNTPLRLHASRLVERCDFV
jgi:3-methyladenine DNA glycosylase AlkD